MEAERVGLKRAVVFNFGKTFHLFRADIFTYIVHVLLISSLFLLISE